MDKIDTEIRFAGMAEERLRREDPHYRVWSFTVDVLPVLKHRDSNTLLSC